jgi:hypothetical protein
MAEHFKMAFQNGGPRWLLKMAVKMAAQNGGSSSCVAAEL